MHLPLSVGSDGDMLVVSNVVMGGAGSVEGEDAGETFKEIRPHFKSRQLNYSLQTTYMYSQYTHLKVSPLHLPII